MLEATKTTSEKLVVAESRDCESMLAIKIDADVLEKLGSSDNSEED